MQIPANFFKSFFLSLLKKTGVYAARGSDVRFVWVDGRQVLKDGRLLAVDEAEVLSEAKRMGLEIRAKIH